jgi:eukaryotic-like serine/threonine-protein kinase
MGVTPVFLQTFNWHVGCSPRAVAYPALSASALPKTIGRYTMFEELAAGGMGVVYLGRVSGASGFQRGVAIKRLHPRIARDPSAVAMFRQEAQLLARVRHPNVVSALDVVQEGGELLLVMEYIHGLPLSMLCQLAQQKKQPIPLEVAVRIACDVLHGLHAVHTATAASGRALSMIHRDVSPQNVLIGKDGVARLLDFGVAKAVTSEDLTAAGYVKGKLSYVAPEQIRGEPVDARIDVFSLSVVLWEMLASVRLFGGRRSVAETLRRVQKGEVPSLRDVSTRYVPPRLEAIVRRGLERDPARRFKSAKAMADALEGEVAAIPTRELSAWLTELAEEPLAFRARQLSWVEGYEDAEPSSAEISQMIAIALAERTETATELSLSETMRPPAQSRVNLVPAARLRLPRRATRLLLDTGLTLAFVALALILSEMLTR